MTFWSSIAIDFGSFRSMENLHFLSVKPRPKRCIQDVSYSQKVCLSVHNPVAEIRFTKYQYKQPEVLVMTKLLFRAVS